MLRIHCCPSILRRLCVAGSAIAVVWAPLALAQPLPEDSATRLAARQLAQEGGELFDEGRFAEAWSACGAHTHSTLLPPSRC